MKVHEIVSEAKKKKKKKAALYGPGPFGMYGTNVGYSGDGGAVGEDWGHNEPPPGPETPPTMPKGTVRVDVSDVYDWYKLGQYISNLKNAKKSQFGKGPPSTIISFGSEEEEHEYIRQLAKLGLDITDIDPGKTKGVKSDPTYNVEAIGPSKSTHTVKFGDTLYSIAQKYKLNVDELKKINGLKNNNIQTGQVLKLAAPTTKSKTKPAIATQPVRKGQAAMIAPSNTTSAFAKTDLTQPTVTGSPHETFLRKKAEAAGMKGAELTAFLSQAAHETLNFKFMSEIGGSLDFRKYDPKYAPKKARSLGNVQPGDGARYKGRGYLQITGRYNYKVVGDGIRQPLEKNPKLLEKPEVAAAAAIWYWKNRVKPDVSNFKDVRDVTGEINPGMKHLDRRKEKFDQFNKLAKK